MSTLNVDALVGVSSANAITVRGEGSATTSLQQGLGKVWCNFEGDGTVAISDSFNTSGITDNTTGDYTIAIATDMANINYSTTASGTHAGGASTCYLAIDHDVPPATDAVTVNAMQGSNDTRIDAELLCFTIHGDLS